MAPRKPEETVIEGNSWQLIFAPKTIFAELWFENFIERNLREWLTLKWGDDPHAFPEEILLLRTHKVGTKVRWLRRQHGISLRHLAAHLKMDVSYLSRIENNKIGVGKKTAHRLAQALHCDFSQLLK